jgi:phage repressor protein C with HTH and peptisase S24 domain
MLVGEISPAVKPGPGIFRESRWQRLPCDISPMPEIDTIRREIESAMKAKGFSKRSLSKAAELSESAVRDLLTRTDNPGIGTLTKIAEALEMPVDRLTGAGLTVPILGNIGAGGEVIFATDPDIELNGDNEFPSVPRPPLVTGRLMALQVVGSSMLPKYEDGDIIYVRRDHEGLLPTYLNRYCAVRTGDGGTFLKVLSPGSEAGRYTLRSLNAPDMENVEVVWASPVLFVMPKQG